MAEATIVVKMRDQFSSSANRMETANKGFNKSLEDTNRKAEQYRKRLDETVRAMAKLETELQSAKSAQREAQKAFRETADAANSEALTAANEKYEQLKIQMSEARRAAKDMQQAMQDLDATGKKNANAAGSRDGTVISTLAKAGATQMIGGTLSQAVGAFANSVLGDAGGRYISSALGTAATGAAVGSMLGPVGTAVGAVAGAALGAVTAGVEEFANKDAYYKQTVESMYSELQEGLSDSLTTGSSIAGTRETDLISFSTLFGDAQVAEQFLSDIKDMANVTPFLYDDLTSMSKTLKTFGYAVSEMIPALTAVGDTGAALGLSVSDMNIVATAIGRMRQTDKVTLEYLNMLSERGIAAIDWMAEAGGISKGDVYSNISAGRYSGEQMAQLILDNMALNYGGAMERQSQTFSGLSSTLEGLTQELYNAQGEGYNAARKQGIQDQIDFLGSEAGGQMQQAYALIGEYQASLENRQEELLRDALSSVMSGSLTGSMEGVSEAFRVQLESLSEDYDRAKLEKNGAEMGRVLMEAKALAEAEYTNTEEYQMQVDAQEELIAGVQQAVAGSYYDAGYDLAKELSRGMTAGLKYQANAIEESVMALAGTGYTWTVHGDGSKEYRDLNGNLIELGTYAYGLARVPYDNYPALLHEGERVLTAAEARRYGGTNLQIAKIADTVVIREDADIDRIAAAIADRVQQARWTDTGV